MTNAWDAWCGWIGRLPLPRRLLRFLPANRSLELAALFTAVASILAGVMVARLLGTSGRGQVVIVATWGQALAWFGGLSIDKAMMARSSVDGSRKIQMPLAGGLWTMILIGLFVASVSAIAVTPVLERPGLSVAIAILVLGTIAYDARAAHLLSQDRWRHYALQRFAQPSIYLLGCAIAVVLTAWNPRLGVALVVTALCTSLWMPALFIGGLPRLRTFPVRRVEFKAMFGFAGAYHVGSVLSFLASRIDLLAISLLFGLAEVGLYSVASSLGQTVTLFGSANLLRGINGKHSSGWVDRGGLVLAATITTVAVICAPWILRNVYGVDFGAAGELARWLCVGGLINYLKQGFNGQLTGLGRPWATAWANGAAVITFAALLPFSDTPIRIAIATLTATALSTAASFGLLRWYDRRRSGPTAPIHFEGDTLTPAPVTGPNKSNSLA